MLATWIGTRVSTAISAYRRTGFDGHPRVCRRAGNCFWENTMNKMNLMGSGLLIGSVITVLSVAQPALAQDATTAPAPKPAATSTNASTNMGVTAVDAGKLIGQNVVDSNGKTIGEIDSVIVDT